MHGLRSAKMLKEYREHASYVNDVKVSMDGSKLITASSDGDVKVRPHCPLVVCSAKALMHWCGCVIRYGI